MTVLITLTTYGSDTGPFFDLYSDVDGYVTAFETGVAKVDLIAGYTSTLVPDFATVIRIQSTGACDNYVDVDVIPASTSTSTTTAAPVLYGPFSAFYASNPSDLCLGTEDGTVSDIYSYVNSNTLVDGRIYYNSNGTLYTENQSGAAYSSTLGLGTVTGLFTFGTSVWENTTTCT